MKVSDILKKYVLPNLPYLMFLWVFAKLGETVRLAPGADASMKMLGPVSYTHLVEPGKAPYETEIEGGLESLQKAVGGSIQAVYPYDDPVALICNEEGKLMGLPLNRSLTDDNGEIYDLSLIHIYGTARSAWTRSWSSCWKP